MRESMEVILLVYLNFIYKSIPTFLVYPDTWRGLIDLSLAQIEVF